MLKREEETAKKQKHLFNKEDTRKKLLKAAELEVKWYPSEKCNSEKRKHYHYQMRILKSLLKKDAEKTGIPVDKLMNYYKSSTF